MAMDGLILGKHKADRIARPNLTEAALVREYVEQSDALEEFRHDIAYWTDEIARDPYKVIPAVENMFRARSSDVERLLAVAEGVEPWSPALRQPHLLARSLPIMPIAAGFVGHAFRARTIVGAGSKLPSSSEARLREFLCSMFWEEVGIVLDSERDLPGWELFNALVKAKPIEGRVGKDVKAFYLSNKHRLLYKYGFESAYDEPDEGLHTVIHVLDDDLIWRGQYYVERFYRLRDFQVVAATQDWNLRDTRRKIHTEKLSGTVERFRDAIGRKSVVYFTDFRAPSIVEKELFSDIIDHDVDTGSTIERVLEDAKCKDRAVEGRIGDNITERLRLLDEFTRANPGKPVSPLVRDLISELQPQALSEPTLALPATAPATWKADKQPGETPPGFVRRVYGEWLGKGFTRATVRHLDPPLGQAITNWLRHNEWPADVDLPTLKEQNTRWVERVEKEGIAAVIPEGSPESVLREARRLTSAKERRRDTQNR